MITNQHSRRKNLRWYYAYCLCSSLVFTRGVFLIYLGRKGLSLTEVALYQTVFNMATALCEIPTGYFGDRCGRRLSLYVGTLLLALHSIGMILCAVPWQFFALAAVEAFAYTFISGTDQALFYELLDECNERSNYLKINSRLLSLQSVMTSIAIFAGSLVAKVSWELLYITMTLIHFFQIFCLTHIHQASSLEEKRGAKSRETSSAKSRETGIAKSRETSSKKKYLLALQQAITYQPALLFIGFLIVFSALDGFYMSYYSSNQIIFEKIGVDISLVGLFLGASYLISSISYMGSEAIARFLGRRRTLLVLITIESLLFAALYIYTNHSMMFFMISLMATLIPEGVFIVAESIIQDNVRNEYRSTILSTVSLFRSAVSAAVFPLIGYLLDNTSVQNMLGVLGLSIGLLTLVAIAGLAAIYRRHHA